eukprot:307714-Alexandrium_andersonii.AAC.1
MAIMAASVPRTVLALGVLSLFPVELGFKPGFRLLGTWWALGGRPRWPSNPGGRVVAAPVG